MKKHTYHFKCLYDAPNSVSGKFEKSWTGRASVETFDSDDAQKKAFEAFEVQYPEASNIRNIRRFGH